MTKNYGKRAVRATVVSFLFGRQADQTADPVFPTRDGVLCERRVDLAEAWRSAGSSPLSPRCFFCFMLFLRHFPSVLLLSCFLTGHVQKQLLLPRECGVSRLAGRHASLCCAFLDQVAFPLSPRCAAPLVLLWWGANPTSLWRHSLPGAFCEQLWRDLLPGGRYSVTGFCSREI